MGLFSKKKEEKSCCGSACTPEKMARAEAEKAAAGIKVLRQVPRFGRGHVGGAGGAQHGD